MENKIAISANCINKSFRNKKTIIKALDDISFKIYEGQLFCIVGPSGCGKSTLIKIILDLEKCDSGKKWINPELRKKDDGGGIAYIQQSSYLLPWRTLYQNACLGAELNNDLSKDSLFRISNSIDNYGLRGFENAYPNTLSGGMEKRVEIIRAIDSMPKLLFCDEPFASIDFVTRLRLSTHFKKMCKFVNKSTTVFVTHDIEEAIFLGDVIAVMTKRPGKILKTYIPDQTIDRTDAVKCRKQPEFQELFEKIWEDLRG